MKRFSEYVLQDFLLKCGEQRRDHLISFLSPKERESLASVPVLSQQFVSEKLFHENLLDYIHYSWFLPTLKSYEPSDVVLFLSALSVQQRGGAREDFK